MIDKLNNHRLQVGGCLVKTGKTYDETVFADQEKLHKQRLERNIRNQAKSLGFQLVPYEG